MRLKSHHLGELKSKSSIECFRCIDDPSTFQEFVDSWSCFRDRVEASEEKFLDFHWVSFIDISKIRVEISEKAFSRTAAGVDSVQC